MCGGLNAHASSSWFNGSDDTCPLPNGNGVVQGQESMESNKY